VTRKLRPVEIPLPEDIQEAVLGLPVNGDLGTTTVGELLRKAQTYMDLAEDAVQKNPLLQVAATHLMQKENRRGTPEIQIGLGGTVSLVVRYNGVSEEPPRTPLPSLGVLREIAAKNGVDISDLGRKKTEILERLRKSGISAISSPTPEASWQSSATGSSERETDSKVSQTLPTSSPTGES